MPMRLIPTMNLNLPRRLMLLVLIPILGLIAIGQMSFRTLYGESKAFVEDVNSLRVFHAEVDDFIRFNQTLTRERDAALRRYGDLKDAQRLEQFRAATAACDQAIAAMVQKLERLELSTRRALFVDKVKEIRTFFGAQLPDVRKKTIEGAGRSGDVFQVYVKLAYNALYISDCYRQTIQTPQGLNVFDAIVALEKIQQQEMAVLSLAQHGFERGALEREELANLRRQYFISTENEYYLLKFQPELRGYFKAEMRKTENDLAVYQCLADLAGIQPENTPLNPLSLKGQSLADWTVAHLQNFERIYNHGFSAGETAVNAHAAQRRRRAYVVGVSLLLGMAASVALTLAITRSTRRNLAEVTKSVEVASADVKAASTQLASASQQISQDATQYASAIETISESLDQVSRVADDNKGHAAKAATVAAKARESADSGLGTISELDSAINSARSSGQRINQVIGRINDLSFQTNLLALNAAVEAARAGEAGAGFAVVAEEVRQLAKRCAEAAKETEELIGVSSKDTAVAIEKSNALAARFKEFSRGIVEVNETVTLISTNFMQQASSIAEINQSVGRQREIAQSMVAASEETASTALSMEGQVDSLNRSVDRMDQLLGEKTTAQARG